MIGKENPVTEIWITKYALSSGILRAFGRRLDADYLRGNYYRQCNEDGSPKILAAFLKMGRDCELTHIDAVRAAQNMRLKKIEVLKKQIAKLEKKTF